MLSELKAAVKPEGSVEKRGERKLPVRAAWPFEEMEHAMERMFEGWFPRRWLSPLRFDRPLASELAFEAWMPKVNVIERDEEVVVRAELPGVEKKDLDISLTENALTLKGQTSREEKEEKGHYYRCEVSRGEFVRTLMLPAGVDTEKAKAEFKEGVLELTLPKLEKAKRRTLKLE